MLLRGESEDLKEMIARFDKSHGLQVHRPSVLQVGGMLNSNKSVSVALEYLGLMSPEHLKFGK